MEKLNVQAHKNAINSSEEYVSESLVTFDRVKTLIYDLLVTEAWKDKVFPLL